VPALPPALVLTAGFGTRLRPLSHVRAKPAIPVAGQPLIRRILKTLAAAGVTRAVLNLHHLPETICRVVGDGQDLGLSVRYSWENPVLGSGGGPRRALPLLDAARILIVNGDTLTDADPVRLMEEHARTGALVTLAVVPNPAPHQYGGVQVNEDGNVVRFVPRGTPGPSWHFIGLQAAEAIAFERLSPNEPSESIASLYPALMREQPGSVRAFRTSASFFDIGTLRDYLETSIALWRAEGSRTGDERADGPVSVGERCDIAHSAWLEGTVLWDDVTIGDDASLTDCVVTDQVSVPRGLRVCGRAISRAEDVPAAAGEDRHGDLVMVPILGR
jgi:mannose-1-phosphate guanylyltransferase